MFALYVFCECFFAFPRGPFASMPALRVRAAIPFGVAYIRGGVNFSLAPWLGSFLRLSKTLSGAACMDCAL